MHTQGAIFFCLLRSELEVARFGAQPLPPFGLIGLVGEPMPCRSTSSLLLSFRYMTARLIITFSFP